MITANIPDTGATQIRLAPRKPPGFKRATENLYFNLVDRTGDERGDAAA